MEKNIGFRKEIEVTAIVSTYDSADYMEGCLDDLIAQTLYQAGKVEILVIDCASPGNEGEIIRKYQESNPNITYVRLTERETLYGAWNVGAKYAEGAYLTNANTDDRHHPECYERLHAELSKNDAIDLVYADVFQGRTPNEKFSDNSQTTIYRYKPYFAPDVLMHYQFGCQPMWRASVHDKIGLFDRELKAAGDYEFNFRFALKGLRAQYIQEPLGLFLERTDSLSQADQASVDEQGELRKRYITPENILHLYELEGRDLSTKEQKVQVFHDISLRASGFEYPWHPGQRFQDAEVSLTALTAALQLQAGNPTLLNNLAVVLHSVGHLDDAKAVLSQLTEAAKASESPIRRNVDRLAGNDWQKISLEFCPDL